MTNRIDETLHPVAPKRVLIADDVAFNRLALRTYLEHDGHVVMEAEDGSVAIETLRANDFDLLFLDLNMPGANGVDVLAFYRVQKNSANPVFVVTVDIPEGLPATLTKMGGCYIIERPITQESVRKAMVTCVTAKNAPCADSASVLHAQPRHVLSRTRFALFLGLSVASVVALVALIATG